MKLLKDFYNQKIKTFKDKIYLPFRDLQFVRVSFNAVSSVLDLFQLPTPKSVTLKIYNGVMLRLSLSLVIRYYKKSAHMREFKPGTYTQGTSYE